MLYDHVIQPFLKSEEERVDSVLHRVTKSATQFASQGADAMSGIAAEALASETGQKVLAQAASAALSGDHSTPQEEVLEEPAEEEPAVACADGDGDADAAAPVVAAPEEGKKDA